MQLSPRTSNYILEGEREREREREREGERVRGRERERERDYYKMHYTKLLQEIITRNYHKKLSQEIITRNHPLVYYQAKSDDL